MARFQPQTENFGFGPWKVTATKSHILSSEGQEREQFEAQLNIPHVPEMIFADNVLRISHESGFGIEFTALDALRLVDSEHETIHVANAKAWKEARADCEFIEKVVHPFDWTFTTDYAGTLLGNGEAALRVEPTMECVDVERLKARDKIHFYADLMLFEDELHDSGCSLLSIKIRVMPSYFFILMRFYMRVDDVLVRVTDTRLFHEFNSNYILREVTKRESKVEDLTVPTSVLTEPNEVAEHLSVKSERRERLCFPIKTQEGSTSHDCDITKAQSSAQTVADTS